MNKTCKGCVAELKCNTTFISSFFVEGRIYKMYILILLGVAMLSSVLTLAIHCIVIVGKEGEEQWEEEQIMKKEKTEE